MSTAQIKNVPKKESHLKVRNTLAGRERSGAVAALMRPVVLASVLAVSIFAFAALILLSGYADELRQTPPGQASPNARSAIGYAGLIDYLKDLDYVVEKSETTKRGAFEYQYALKTYFIPNGFATEDYRKLPGDEARLIVLPKWSVRPLPIDAGQPGAGQGWVGKTRNGSLINTLSLRQITGKTSEEGEDTEVGISRLRRGVAAPEFRYISYFYSEDDDTYTARENSETVSLNIERLQYFDRDTRSLYGMDLFEMLQDLQEQEKAAKENAKKTTEDEDKDPEDKAVKDTNQSDETPDSIDDVIINSEATGGVFPERHTVLMRAGDYPVLIRLDDTQVYLLSDPDLLNTTALATRTGANMAVSIIDEVIADSGMTSQNLDVDVTLHGAGSRNNLVKLMTRPPFLAMTLCLLGAAALLGWQATTRFGDPILTKPDFAQGPVALAKTAANLMETAGRSHRTGAGFAELVKQQVIQELGYHGRTAEQLSALLGAREKVRHITPQYDDLQRAIAEAGPETFIQHAQALSHWRTAMLSPTPVQEIT